MTSLDKISYARQSWRRPKFGNAMLAVIILALLPNIVFLAISPWLMVRRAISPLLYILFAIPALLLPPVFAVPLFLVAVAIDAYLLISFAFDMPFEASFAALRYLGEIDIGASFLYIGGVSLAIVVAVGVGFLVNRHRAALRAASLTPALAVAVLFGTVDLASNGFKPLMQPALFDSALLQNGLTSDVIAARRRNVLFVMVEGMGAYADPRERALLENRLNAAAGDRYDLRHGTSPYFGSTTGATSRELCGKWGTFADYLDAGPQDCLPARLAAAGFDTISYHAGYSDLFSRKQWYPNIGLQTMHFREDIEKSSPKAASRLCGTVTVGLCDEEMGELVRRELLRQDGRPKFVYWLTLNSHVPYAPRVDGVLGCGTDRAVIRDVGPCQLTDIWAGVFDSIASIASDPALPPLDIVVAGDHNTPMWSRSAFRHFIKDRVDWYYLKDRREAAVPGDSPSPRDAN